MTAPDLTIPASGALDFLALGAIIHRLDPGRRAVSQGADVRHSRERRRVQRGGQPRRLLRSPHGHRHGDGPIPDRRPHRRARARRWACSRSTSTSSTTARAARTWRPSTATAATACARPVVFYNRANEAAALLKPGDIDWASHLRDGRAVVPQRRAVRGACRDHAAELIIEGMQAAQAPRAPWCRSTSTTARSSGVPRVTSTRAPTVFSRIVEHVDVLVGNEEDLQKALGVKGPEAAASSKLDPSAFFETIEQVVKRYPHIKVVATTLREVHTTNRHTWSAVAWINGTAAAGADVRARRLRSRRWRRRLRVGPHLRTAHR